jgi:hypothetical protein
MKLYSLNRLRLFQLIAAYPDIILSRAGSLFVEAWVPDEDTSIVPHSVYQFTMKTKSETQEILELINHVKHVCSQHDER